MGLQALRVACGLALAVVAGCAGARAPYQRDVDGVLAATRPPPSPQPIPSWNDPSMWRVGTWALYRTSDHGQPAFRRISTVAIDACGVWIEVLDESYGQRSSWTMCIQPLMLQRLAAAVQARVVIARADDGPPEVYDFRVPGRGRERADFTSVVAQLFPVQGGDVQLISWARCGAASIVPQLAEELASEERPRPPPRLFFGIGPELGWLGGHRDETSTGTVALDDAVLGYRVTPRLDLVANVRAPVLNHYSPDRTDTATLFVTTLGARWKPFGALPPSLAPYHRNAVDEPYVQADLGYANLEVLSPTRTVLDAHGLAAGLGIGWLTFLDRYLAVGMEVRDELVWLDHGEGLRDAVSFLSYFELHF